MALTFSNEFEIGTEAPDFKLLDTVTDEFLSLENLKGNEGTIILFICNHCPYVIHINTALVEISNRYQEREINFIAINSNDVKNYPEDDPKLMKICAEKLKYPFPYLYDETQEVAKRYNAACTPDIYLFDKFLKLTYHGQFDDSRPGGGQSSTGDTLKNAMDTLLIQKSFEGVMKPSMGCGIKWK